MNEENIQAILDKLGRRVSHLSEENRRCRLRDDAGQELIGQLGQYLSPAAWVNLYESTANMFVKDLMKEWGAQLFPEDYKCK